MNPGGEGNLVGKKRHSASLLCDQNADADREDKDARDHRQSRKVRTHEGIVPAGWFADSIRLKLNSDKGNLSGLTTTDTGGCMSLNIKTRKVDSVVIVDLSG